MQKLTLVLLSLLCVFGSANGAQAKEKDGTFTVLQLNLWHGGTKVPNGYDAVLNVLDEMDADVIFLCEIRDKGRFIPRLINDLKERGKEYHGETIGSAIGLMSKFELSDIEKKCIVPGDEGRAMIKAVATIAGQQVAFYSCHLDYIHYECYMPRGYSGTSWKKIDGPVTDEQTVLAANRLSYRDESIRAFVKESREDIDAGRIVIMGGDFNEPSHLDWQADTKDLWDHNGAIINWDCSVMLDKAGFIDTFREKYPNPVKYPGFTFPAGNKTAEAAKLEKLAWAPDVDERDRIDFIYYYPTGGRIVLKKTKLVGPEGTVLYGKIVGRDSKDNIVVPQSVWPSDHKGNLATFKIKCTAK